MIEFEPFPLLEASVYLTARSTDIDHPRYYAAAKYFNMKLLSQPNRAEEFGGYARSLTALEERLGASVTVDEETLKIVFSPLKTADNSCDNLSFSVCDILTDCCNLLTINDFDKAFELIEKALDCLPQRILYALNIEPKCETPSSDNECVPDQLSLIKLINSKVSNNESKMVLIELVLDPKKYLDMLKAAILPVAKEFTLCRNIWEQFIDIYRSECSAYPDQPALLRSVPAAECDPDPAVTDVYPLVMGSFLIFDFFSPELNNRHIIAMGVLYDVIISRNIDADVLNILSVLSEPKRFHAVRILVKRSAYSSEIARELGVSVVTASQHLSILQGAGIVESCRKGNKVYYSLNHARLDFFIEKFRELFPSPEIADA